AVQAVAARLGDVERPVAGASVGVVVGVPGGVVDLGVGVGRVHPGGVLLARPAAPVAQHHRGRGGAAPGLAAAVPLGVVAGVDALGAARHVQLGAPGAAAWAHRHGLASGYVRGHRPQGAHARHDGGAGGAVEGDAELVGGDPAGRDERVDGHPGVVVALAGHRRAVDVALAVGPAAEHVPAGQAGGVAGPRFDL